MDFYRRNIIIKNRVRKKILWMLWSVIKQFCMVSFAHCFCCNEHQAGLMSRLDCPLLLSVDKVSYCWETSVWLLPLEYNSKQWSLFGIRINQFTLSFLQSLHVFFLAIDFCIDCIRIDPRCVSGQSFTKYKCSAHQSEMMAGWFVTRRC